MILAMNTRFSDKNPELAALYGDHLATVTARHDHALEQAGASHASCTHRAKLLS